MIHEKHPAAFNGVKFGRKRCGERSREHREIDDATIRTVEVVNQPTKTST